MQIVAKKGVKIYRDFYIDMDIKPAFCPKIVKLPITEIGNSVKWEKTIGDQVSAYEIIAKNKNDIPVYSPVNGVLKEITVGPEMGESNGFQYAVIEVNRETEPTYPLWNTESRYSKDNLLEIITRAGIINESYSDYFKNTINKSTKYQKILIDCIDEQPFDLSRTAVFLNFRNEVLGGAEIIANAFGIQNKELLIMKNFRTQELFKKGVPGVTLTKVKGKYPIFPEVVQYAHKCTALLVGAQCCRAVYRAAYFGEPQISSVVTVWGDGVEEPKNIEVYTGTTVKELLENCRANGILERVVAGGVMKGYIASPNWPLYRWDRVLTVMPLKRHHRTIECINCGRCADVCPMKLAPYYILRSSRKPGEKIAKQLCAGMCIYCGACSYVCPSRLPLSEKIREYNKVLIKGGKNEKV